MDRPTPGGCPRFIGENQAPPSPTSSLRGVFSRSRPVSYSPSESPTIASDCPTNSPFTSDISDDSSGELTATTSTFDDALYMSINSTAIPHNMAVCLSSEDKMCESSRTPQVVPASSDVKPLDTSFISRMVHTLFLKTFRTPTSKIRFTRDEMIVGHFISGNGCAGDIPSLISLTPSNSKRRSWRAVRHTVSHILHREPKEKDQDIPLYPAARTAPNAITSPRALKPYKSASLMAKSSSPSIFTNCYGQSAKRSTISPSPRLLAGQQAQGMAHKQHLHHSRSFSGYPNVLTAMTDECSEVDTDAGLDEATIEAQEVMKDLRRKQVFTRI